MKQGGILLIVAAVVVFLGGALVGMKLLTQGAEVTSSAPTCEPRTVREGEELTPNLVRVNVYNASRIAGLADRVSRQLQQRNFLPGAIANNPTELGTDDVVVVADDPKDPRVQLVVAQFAGKVTVQPGEIPGTDGVSVLVGKNYDGRKLKGKTKDTVTVDRVITSCVPIAS